MSWILLAALVASPFDDGNGAKPSLDKEVFPLPAGAVARLGSLRFWHAEGGCTLFFWAPGKQIVCEERDQIVVWDAETGRRIRTLQGHKGGVHHLIGSPDGKLLASAGDDKTIRIRDGADGRQFSEIHIDENVGKLCFSPDSRLLAILREDGAVELRKTPDGALQHSFRGDLGKIVSIAFSPVGARIATYRVKCKDSPSLQFWELGQGRPSLHPSAFKALGSLLEFSPDGAALITAGNGAETQLWSVTTGEVVFTVHPAGHATFAPDGLTIALTNPASAKIEIVDARSGGFVREFGSIGGECAFAFSPDGKTLAAAGDGGALKLWNVETGVEVVATTGHKAPVTSLGYSPDGRKLASTDESSLAIVWNLVSRSQERRLVDQEKSVPVRVAFSPDGKSLAVGSNTGSVHVLDMRTGENRASFAMKSHLSVDDLVFTLDGSLLAASMMVNDESTLIWDVKAGAEKRLAVGSEVISLAFGRNGRFLATGCDDGSARLWDAGTGRELRRFELGDKASVGAVALRGDGWALAAAPRSQPLRVWDLKTKRELSRRYLASQVEAMTFSPDGKLLATGCEDGAVQILDLATGRELANFNHGTQVDAIAFAPDGQSIASGGEDGMIMIWSMPKP